MQRLQLYKGIAIFVGTVIGAGVLGIPWAVGKSGFLAGLLHILALGLAMMFVNLCVGELTLRTQGDHQLAGYAGLYLGKWGKRLMMLSLMIGIYGALIAYTVGIGQSAAQIFGLEPWLWSALFYILGIILVSLDIKRIGLPEMFLSLTKLGLLITIFIVISASGLIQSENLTKFVTPEFLAPYGVVLFAYLGMSAVPEVREVMLGSWQLMKNAIIIGSLIPIILYALFTFAVVGSLGSNIS
ncbi:MAG: aromatic amino acid transport family protein, partial [Candidatus Woesearchaeota archaeon]